MAGLALTILLALLWLAFVGLGYWHGGWRQIVLLAGMLLSYAVASEWTVPNGHDLATRFHWSLPRATTAVGLLYLLGGTLVLGLLGSFALERPYPFTMVERQCGAAIGVLNGGLLLALVLRTLRSYAYVAGGGDALHTSVLSRFLIESIGYVLLVALLLGLVAVVVGLILVQRRHAPETPIVDPLPAPVTALPPPPQQIAQPPVNVAPPAPLQAPPRPAASAPIYMAEPIIDWPSAPPPGTPIESNGASQPVPAPPAPERQPEVPKPGRPGSILAMPVLPQRVEPPMRYPVGELIAAAALPVRAEVQPPAPTPPPAPTTPHTVAPPAPVRVAELGPPSTIPPAARPTLPPPGNALPVSAPPTNTPPPMPLPTVSSAPLPPQPTPPAPESSPESLPPVGREPTVAMEESMPAIPPPDGAATTDTPPVVREIDVTTQDVPLVALAKAQTRVITGYSCVDYGGSGNDRSEACGRPGSTAAAE